MTDETGATPREEILRRVYRRGSALRARRQMAVGAAGVVLLASLATPFVLDGRDSSSGHALRETEETPTYPPTPHPSPVTTTPAPTPSATASAAASGVPKPARSGDTVPTPGASTPAPRPGQCDVKQVVVSAASRKGSYAWRSHDVGDSAGEDVYLDVVATNNGPDCVWFPAVGHLFENVQPAPGDFDPSRYDQCLDFSGVERPVVKRGGTHRWTYRWDQRCGAPDAKYRTPVAPGEFRASVYVCYRDCACVAGRECTSTGWDAKVAEARFTLRNTDDPSPTASASVSPSAVPSTGPPETPEP